MSRMTAASGGVLLTGPVARERVVTIWGGCDDVMSHNSRSVSVQLRVPDRGLLLHLRQWVCGPQPLPPGHVSHPGADIRIPVRWYWRNIEKTFTLSTFFSGDLCCRRRCTPVSKCGHDTYGCETDEVSRSLYISILHWSFCHPGLQWRPWMRWGGNKPAVFGHWRVYWPKVMMTLMMITHMMSAPGSQQTPWPTAASTRCAPTAWAPGLVPAPLDTRTLWPGWAALTSTSALTPAGDTGLGQYRSSTWSEK